MQFYLKQVKRILNIYEQQPTSTANESPFREVSSTSSNVNSNLTPSNPEFFGESGRTALHFACLRDDDYEVLRHYEICNM